MSELSTGALFGLLAILILLSAMFSASETAMMALNRYRLRHLVERGRPAATLAHRLLERPDRLLGVILLGNNFANIAASSVATLITLRLYGDAAIAASAGVLTVVVLIFAEVAPKTVAALHPERIAFPAAFVLTPLLTLAYPLVWFVNAVANLLLRLLGIPLARRDERLSSDELRTVVREAAGLIPKAHRRMLLRILDLEKITVNDIMVPRSAIEAIDLEDDWEDILAALTTSHHSRLPVYEGGLDKVIGILHLRNVLHLIQREGFGKDALRALLREPYFIAEATPVTQALLDMQDHKHRFGLVVDEYGDIQGLVTVEEILEEIVGEFTTPSPALGDEIRPAPDGGYLISGSASIRDINRRLGWHLPTGGPKTLNGLILEYLEDIPEPGTSLMLAGHPVDILQTTGNAVKVAKVMPALQPRETEAAGH